MILFFKLANWYKKLLKKEELYNLLLEKGYTEEESKIIINKIKPSYSVAEQKNQQWAYFDKNENAIATNEPSPEYAVNVGNIKSLGN